MNKWVTSIYNKGHLYSAFQASKKVNHRIAQEKYIKDTMHFKFKELCQNRWSYLYKLMTIWMIF